MSERNEKMGSLLDNAFKLGAAENAIGVLHNIGNTMTVLRSECTDDTLFSELSLGISIVKKLLAGEVENKDKFEKVVNSIESIVQEMVARNRIIDENITKITEMVTAQQRLANYTENYQENINLRMLVKDCLLMMETRIAKFGISIRLEVDPLSEVFFERVSLFQILNNLITNALESIEARLMNDPFYDDPELVIKLTSFDRNEIFISDNGAGMAVGVGKNVFEFGFSTKKRGSGFGLHHCAMIMNRNDGRLELSSAGENKGATAKLSFSKSKVG